VVIDDTPVAIVRSGGQLYAIEDVCSHEDMALSEGEVESGTIECWRHGSRFDLKSGRAIGPSAIEPVPTFPVKINGRDVWVAIHQSA
jgi:3-phenylpropionate/trans-cinnamate dioxygenase ferredoxin component